MCFPLSTVAAELDFPSTVPKHPRLFLTRDRENELKESMKRDPFLSRQIDMIRQKANKLIQQPVTTRQLPGGKSMLGSSRRGLERITTFAFMYRMHGRQDYADAAIKEMLAVCRFTDWNPAHYLDTAEMATGVAFGYDWLFEVLSKEQKEEIREALIRNVLQTALPLYENKSGWTTRRNNWNEVCNSGVIVAALALAETDAPLVKRVVAFAVENLAKGLEVYRPDGVYPEGPEYWGFGASYSVLAIASLSGVFRTNFGLLKTEGLDRCGDYYMGMSAPSFRCFNYADGTEQDVAAPLMFALARCYDRPDYAVWYRNYLEKMVRFNYGRFAVFNALWYTPTGTDSDFAKTNLARKYRGIQELVAMRTSWNAPNAAYVGFKAGDNAASHGQLDVGTFVYEVDGIRWAVDLGKDNYNLPGYFGKLRWNYFRMNNRSHNTLVVGDRLQNEKARCLITVFEEGGTDRIARAATDMTQAYQGQASSVVRTVELKKDRSLVVEDVLQGVSESVRWGMMTAATIETNGKTAMLTQKGKRLRAELLSGQSKRFEIISAKPPTERENQNQGFSILAAVAEPENGSVRLRVILSPVD